MSNTKVAKAITKAQRIVSITEKIVDLDEVICSHRKRRGCEQPMVELKYPGSYKVPENILQSMAQYMVNKCRQEKRNLQSELENLSK